MKYFYFLKWRVFLEKSERKQLHDILVYALFLS